MNITDEWERTWSNPSEYSWGFVSSLSKRIFEMILFERFSMCKKMVSQNSINKCF